MLENVGALIARNVSRLAFHYSRLCRLKNLIGDSFIHEKHQILSRLYVRIVLVSQRIVSHLLVDQLPVEVLIVKISVGVKGHERNDTHAQRNQKVTELHVWVSKNLLHLFLRLVDGSPRGVVKL